MNDLINRQAAIDAICKACSMEEDYHNCDGYPNTSTWCYKLVALRALPSAQSEHLHTVMEKIGKRYEEAMNTPRIKNPMAWALYETWKEYDR